MIWQFSLNMHYPNMCVHFDSFFWIDNLDYRFLRSSLIAFSAVLQQSTVIHREIVLFFFRCTICVMSNLSSADTQRHQWWSMTISPTNVKWITMWVSKRILNEEKKLWKMACKSVFIPNSLRHIVLQWHTIQLMKFWMTSIR